MPDTRRTWRDLDSDSLERAYSPSSCIGGDYQPYVEAYAERSAVARATRPWQTHRYGREPHGVRQDVTNGRIEAIDGLVE